MKRINFKELTNVLSEKELKGVIAGLAEKDNSRCPTADPCGGTCTNNNGIVGQCMTDMWADCKCTTRTL
jgi:hypothetical protein